MSSQEERLILSCLRSCDNTIKELKLILDKLKAVSKKSDQYTVDNTIKLLIEISSALTQSSGTADLTLLSEKIRGIKTACELVSDKMAEDSGIFSGGPLAAQMCYSELAMVLQV